MKCDREEVLKSYLKSEILKEKTGMSDEELMSANFTDDSGNILLEVVKKLILSYCKEDGDIVVLRNINNSLSQ